MSRAIKQHLYLNKSKRDCVHFHSLLFLLNICGIVFTWFYLFYSKMVIFIGMSEDSNNSKCQLHWIIVACLFTNYHTWQFISNEIEGNLAISITTHKAAVHRCYNNENINHNVQNMYVTYVCIFYSNNQSPKIKV